MTLPPIFTRKVKGGAGRAAEGRAASRLGAKVIAGSGSVEGYKGDLDAANFRIESKSTQNKSIGLKYDWLRKITKEALDVTKYPALLLQFTNGKGEIVEEGAWVCVPESVFKELMVVAASND